MSTHTNPNVKMPKSKSAVPDRWEDYSNIGEVIEGTQFITFKVPLKESIQVKAQLKFTPQLLLETLQSRDLNLGLVIDLTNTTRYYDRSEFEENNVLYAKIFVPGHVIPADDIFQRFSQTVDSILEQEESKDRLIGVHCTHGVNRTGYMVSRYMIERLGIEPNEAIEACGKARGYPIERENYLGDLKKRKAGQVTLGLSSDSKGDKHANSSTHRFFNDPQYHRGNSERGRYNNNQNRRGQFSGSFYNQGHNNEGNGGGRYNRNVGETYNGYNEVPQHRQEGRQGGFYNGQQRGHGYNGSQRGHCYNGQQRSRVYNGQQNGYHNNGQQGGYHYNGQQGGYHYNGQQGGYHYNGQQDRPPSYDSRQQNWRQYNNQSDQTGRSYGKDKGNHTFFE